MRADLPHFVRSRRLSLGMSRGDLAREVGTSRRAIEVLEGGADIRAWPVGQVLDLAAALDVPARNLLEDEQPTGDPGRSRDDVEPTDAEIRMLTEIATGRFSEQRLSDRDRRLLGGLLEADAIRLEDGRYVLSPDTAADLGL